MTRELDIRIEAAAEVGFVVWDGGKIVAALQDPQQLAMWIEARAMKVAGESERFADEVKTDFPNVIRATPRKGLFSRG